MSIVGSARPISSVINIDKQMHRTYTSSYEVISNDPTDGPALICTANGLPNSDASYVWYNTTDQFAFFDGASAKLRELKASRLLWTVEVKHTTVQDSKSGGGNTRQQKTGMMMTERGLPTDEPWEIGGSFAQFNRPVTRDKDNVPLLNTVEEPFVPAIEIDDSRKSIVLKKNLPTIDLQKWIESSDTVNSNAMWGLQPRQIKLNQWRWQLRFYGPGIGFVENDFEFHLSWEKDDAGNVVGWTHVVLNEGYRLLVNAAAAAVEDKYERIVLKDQASTKPFMINEAGDAVVAATGTPFYKKLKIYREYDFASLGLPDPLPGGVFI